MRNDNALQYKQDICTSVYAYKQIDKKASSK